MGPPAYPIQLGNPLSYSFYIWTLDAAKNGDIVFGANSNTLSNHLTARSEEGFVGYYSQSSFSLVWAQEFSSTGNPKQIKQTSFAYDDNSILVVFNFQMMFVQLSLQGVIIQQTQICSGRLTDGIFFQNAEIDMRGNIHASYFDNTNAIFVGWQKGSQIPQYSYYLKDLVSQSFGLVSIASCLMYDKSTDYLFTGGKVFNNLALHVRKASDGSFVFHKEYQVATGDFYSSASPFTPSFLNNMFASTINMLDPTAYNPGVNGIFVQQIVHPYNYYTSLWVSLNGYWEQSWDSLLFMQGSTMSYTFLYTIYQGSRDDYSLQQVLGLIDDITNPGSFHKYKVIGPSNFYQQAAKFISKDTIFLAGFIQPASSYFQSYVLYYDLQQNCLPNPAYYEKDVGLAYFGFTPNTGVVPSLKTYTCVPNVWPSPGLTLINVLPSQVIGHPGSTCSPSIGDLYISAPSVLQPTITCYAKVTCQIFIGLYTTMPTTCADAVMSFQISYNGITIDSLHYFPLQLIQDGNQVSLIVTALQSQTNLAFNMIVTASLIPSQQLKYPYVLPNSTYQFVINIADGCKDGIEFTFVPQFNYQTYVLTSPAIVIQFPPFQINYPQCGDIYYKIQVDNSPILPSFIQYFSQNNTIAIFTNDPTYCNNIYEVYVAALIVYGKQNIVQVAQFQLEIIDSKYYIHQTNSSSFNLFETQSYVKAIVGETRYYSIVYIISSIHQNYIMYVNLHEAQSFATFDTNSNTFVITPTIKQANQVFPVTLIVKTQSASYQKGIFINVISNAVIIKNSTRAQNNTQNLSSIPYNSEAELHQIFNSSYQLLPGNLTAFILKITSLGVVTVQFSQDVFNNILQNNNTEYFNQSNIQIQILFSETQQKKLVNYSINSIDGKIMKVQLYFNNTSSISMFQVWDQLQITFLNQSNIYALGSNQQVYLFKAGYTITKPIPAQTDLNDTFSQTIQSITDAIFNVMNSTIFGNVATNIIMYDLFKYLYIFFNVDYRSNSMQQLLGMLNSFQIISHLPLLSITLPAQYNLISFFLIKVTQFQFLPLQNLINDCFKFGDEDQIYFNQFFDNMGYGSLNLLLNSGSIIITLIASLILTLVFKLISLIKIKRNNIINKIKTYTESIFLYSFILGSVLSSSIDIMISVILNISQVKFLIFIYNILQLIFHTSGEAISALLSLFLFFVLLATPLLSYLIIRKNKKRLENPTIKQFKYLYEDFIPNNNSIYFTSILLIKKYAFVFSLIAFASQPWLQILFTQIGSIFIMAFLIQMKPYDKMYINYVEIANEIALYIILTTCLIYTDLVLSTDVKHQAGNVSTALVIFHFFSNIIFMFAVFVQWLYTIIKRRLRIRKFNKVQTLNMLNNTNCTLLAMQNTTNTNMRFETGKGDNLFGNKTNQMIEESKKNKNRQLQMIIEDDIEVQNITEEGKDHEIKEFAPEEQKTEPNIDFSIDEQLAEVKEEEINKVLWSQHQLKLTQQDNNIRY